MFDPTSRYYTLENATYTMPDGRIVTYKRRRFLPDPESLPLLVEARAQQSDRIDLVTARTLGDPLQFWRVADANYAMHPYELTSVIGRVIRVPIPQP